MSTLSARFSRELRAPLTVLRGYLEWLQRGASEEQLVAIDQIASQVGQMQAMIDQVQLLTTLREAEDSDLQQTVAVPGVLAQLKEQAEELSAGVHSLDFQVDETLFLTGNSRWFESAAGNLIANAVRFTPPGGSVQVIWKLRDDFIELTVRDTGFGIPEKDLPHLTERFYRSSHPGLQTQAGAGLGLSIVEEVMALHGGRLRIRSTEGEGSEFCCEIPLELKADAL